LLPKAVNAVIAKVQSALAAEPELLTQRDCQLKAMALVAGPRALYMPKLGAGALRAVARLEALRARRLERSGPFNSL
jgi:hypothetical protein